VAAGDVPRAIDRIEIEAGNFRFTGRACGPNNGRRVLCLHGFPQTSWAWRDQLWALGHAGYRAVAPDQRGYCSGARPSETSHYGTEYLIGDVIALADSMEMERFDLVGHDWGGFLAWMVAERLPDRVRSLSVVSTPHPLALQDALAGGDPEQAARIGDPVDDRDQLIATSPVSRAADISVPLLLFHGRQDARVPVHHAEALAAALEQAGQRYKLTIYSDEGHRYARPQNVVDCRAQCLEFLLTNLRVGAGLVAESG